MTSRKTTKKSLRLSTKRSIGRQTAGSKTRANALTSEEFAAFIQTHGITEFFIAGADAVSCVKSTCFNMAKSGYSVHVLSDCITSYDKKKIDEMLRYYESKGCVVETLREAMGKSYEEYKNMKARQCQIKM